MEEAGTVIQQTLKEWTIDNGQLTIRDDRTNNCQLSTVNCPLKKVKTATLTLDRINLPIAKLDTGLLPDECRRLIKSLYKNRPGINWETQPLDYILLEYLKESKEPSLF